MIDVSELMFDPDFCTRYPVTRARADGTFAAEGEWTPGTPRSLLWYGSVQPAKDADKVLYLPEGERAQEAVNCYGSCELKMADGYGQESDIILFNGNTYRVAMSKPWVQSGYWYAFAVQFK
jgi:hypothetical protein